MQITVRTGDDEELEERIRRFARDNDLSLNQAALALLRRGSGLDRPPMTEARRKLLDMCGAWKGNPLTPKLIEALEEDNIFNRPEDFGT